jgi:hypothetical protein
MFRSMALRCVVVLVAAATAAACSDDPFDDTPTAPTPTEISRTFDGVVTINGAVTHAFDVQRPGTVTVRFEALEPDAAAVLGLSLGTWNGTVCDIKLAADNATQGTTVIGTASTTGNFCARIYDVGKLTAPSGYLIVVTHF